MKTPRTRTEIEITAYAEPPSYTQDDFVSMLARLIQRGEEIRGKVAQPDTKTVEFPVQAPERKAAS